MDKERKPHKHTEAATSSPLLSIRRLSAAYDGRTVLHDVDLEVYEHDFLGIIGPNGGGKTTLIKCILGLLRPTGGEIIKYHEPLTTGYLPQYNSIDRSFPISVLEVVLSGLSSKKSLTGRFNDRHREKARQVIHRMGLEGLEHRAIGQLSGGQLQRALLGRAIISDPQLLILDEPSTYIDKRFEARLYQLLAEINRDWCLAAKGMGCHECVDVCNYEALELGADNVPVVDVDACNGCGACELACISLSAGSITAGATDRAIVVRPTEEVEA